MATYVIALDTGSEWNPSFNDNYVRGVVGPDAVHAVEYPADQAVPWEDLETVCGRPTRGMTRADLVDPARWPQPKWRSKACPACERLVRRS